MTSSHIFHEIYTQSVNIYLVKSFIIPSNPGRSVTRRIRLRTPPQLHLGLADVFRHGLSALKIPFIRNQPRQRGISRDAHDCRERIGVRGTVAQQGMHAEQNADCCKECADSISDQQSARLVDELGLEVLLVGGDCRAVVTDVAGRKLATRPIDAGRGRRRTQR